MEDYKIQFTGKQTDDALWKALHPDTVPVKDSLNLITSGAVKDAIEAIKYIVDHIDPGYSSADKISFNNFKSGLLAETVQDAIDEVSKMVGKNSVQKDELGGLIGEYLKTWTGSSSITTLGTIIEGTWNGAQIGNDFLQNPKMTLWGNEVELGGSTNGSILLKNGTHEVKLEVTNEGYLHVSGAIYSDSFIAAFGKSDKTSPSGAQISATTWGAGESAFPKNMALASNLGWNLNSRVESLEANPGGVSSFGTKTGEITLRSGSKVNGDVNLSMIGNMLTGSVYGLKGSAFFDENYFVNVASDQEITGAKVFKSNITLSKPSSTADAPSLLLNGGLVASERNSMLNHALKLGYNGDDKMHFYEIGGVFQWHKYSTSAKTDTIEMELTSNGIDILGSEIYLGGKKARIWYDSANNCIRTNIGFVSDSFISAFGKNASSTAGSEVQWTQELNSGYHIATIKIGGTTQQVYAPIPGNSGTVTSVGLSVPTGFIAGGTPVTGEGTLSLTFATGYSLPTTAKQTGWDSTKSAVDSKMNDWNWAHGWVNDNQNKVVLVGNDQIIDGMKTFRKDVILSKPTDGKQPDLVTAGGYLTSERDNNYHSIWLSVGGKNEMVFREYGASFLFNKTTSDSDVTIAKIREKGINAAKYFFGVDNDNVYLEYDKTNNCLHTNVGIVSDSFIAAFGKSTNDSAAMLKLATMKTSLDAYSSAFANPTAALNIGQLTDIFRQFYNILK